MTAWKTAKEIEGLYLVTADRLEAYGRRGNLSFRREAGGSLMFEEAAVARLFRARSGMVSVGAAAAANPGFGILGAMQLGQPAGSVRVSRRDLRARAFRDAREIVEQARRKTG